jgi:di/tricarboxylate transporter
MPVSADIIIVLVLLVAVIAVFALELLPVDVTTLALLASLVLTGILTPQEAFAGFASDVLIILAAVFVISGTMIKTGVMDRLAHLIFRFGRGHVPRLVASVTTLAAGTSAFFSNTSATAVLMPTVMELSRKAEISPSRLLMPLAFASILGGTCTLIGTSTNMAGSSLISRLGMEPVSLFEFAGIGIILASAGIAWLVLIGHRIVPARLPEQLTEEYGLREFLSVLVPVPESSAIDQRLADLGLEDLGLTPLLTIRDGERLSAHPLRKLRAGSKLVVKGSPEALMRARARRDFEIEADAQFGDAEMTRDEVAIGEAVLMPQSQLVGKTLRQSEFFHRFKLVVLAVYRRGQAHPAKIENMRMKVGDVLLLQGAKADMDRLKGNTDLWGLMQVDSFVPTKRQGIFALAALGLAILAASTGLLPLSVSLLIAGLLLVATRCVEMEDAYRMIEWRLLVLIAGMTSFGFAMQKTGDADFLAELMVGLTLPFGTYATLAAFSLVTVVLTQPMSNAAAALAVLPVAVAAAGALGIDPRSAAILVTLSASLSFITPLEPASLLVYGPGKYRFTDFILSGMPLTVLMVALLVWLVPVFWPL